MFTQIRPFLLLLTSALITIGWLPPDAMTFLELHGDSVAAAVMALWAAFAFWRNRKQGVPQ